ncbi:MAG TPA: hypothetical protein VMM36_11010 [Opitutaceae bacterium]|nr:hypothetical protein [Opitutaceae bacterium]
MNRTLLLILCDFLLLTLLALTRWEQVEPERTRAYAQPQSQEEGESPGPANDLVDLMRVSLEDERQQREQVADQLEATQQQLESREGQLSQTEQEKAAIAADLERKTAEARQIEERAEAAARDAEARRLRIAQLQRDLEQREQESARQKEAVERLEREGAVARDRIESLNVAVKVAEQEKILLRENLEDARTEVAVIREEKQVIQEQAGVLAEGVGKLADSSTELTREIRDNRPINANTLFADFLDNQIAADLETRRSGLLGQITNTKSVKTILVSDGTNIFALLHATDAPLNYNPPIEYQGFDGKLRRPSGEAAVTAVAYYQHDPRVALLPVDAATATRLGARVYSLGADPFKFPEAVLVSNNGRYYGEVEFKLDASTPRYVRMKTKIFTRLFGEFSPSTGDLVFSKTGELLGMMVNSTYCAVLLELPVLTRIPAGENASGLGTREKLTAVRDGMNRLPLKLQ